MPVAICDCRMKLGFQRSGSGLVLAFQPCPLPCPTGLSANYLCRLSATCDRVMAHMESFRTNTVDTRAAYVAISRARSHAALYTDSRTRLAGALGLRDGAQVGAIGERTLTFDASSDRYRCKQSDLGFSGNFHS